MKENNIIRDKSYKFALDIIEIFKSLKTQREHIISKQLLRNGTSIGANREPKNIRFNNKNNQNKLK
jgi:four helix bundle protein